MTRTFGPGPVYVSEQYIAHPNILIIIFSTHDMTWTFGPGPIYISKQYMANPNIQSRSSS